MKSVLFFLLSALLFSGCSKINDNPVKSSDEIVLGGSDPIDPTAKFTRVQNEVFTPNCTSLGCHDVLGHQSELILSAGKAYSGIFSVISSENPNIMRIKAGDPSNSQLFRKIAGVGIMGDRMPLGMTPPLTDSQILLVRNWIRRGAPND